MHKRIKYTVEKDNRTNYYIFPNSNGDWVASFKSEELANHIANVLTVEGIRHFEKGYDEGYVDGNKVRLRGMYK